MDYKDFSELGIDDKILQAVAEIGYTTPTPVQEKAIPLAVSRCDLLVQAPTGTGKTAAFAIPLLNALDDNIKGVQAVVLCPTRELAMQITAEMKKLAANLPGVKIVAVYGGQNIDRQFASLRKNPQVVVGTTGRVMDHIRRKTLALDTVAAVVLDEADEMLDMGFKDDIDYILERTNPERQTMLFSATMPKEILEISGKFQNEPVSVKTTCDGMDLPPITQYVVRVREDTKYDILKSLINKENYKNVLIFCNTKVRASELNEQLNRDNYLSVALHGDLRQRERDKVMKAFRDHAVNILVATDVAARGIDVDGIEAIINYDIPFDEEYYVHRIGRTARANADGCSYSFATGRDKANLTACEKVAKSVMHEYEIEGKTEVVKSARKEFAVPTVRFFINVGEKDGATVENIKEYFVSSTAMSEGDVYDVTLRDIYGFIEVDKKFENDIMGLVGQKCFKRKLAVEVSAARGEKKGRNVEHSGGAKRRDYGTKREYKPRDGAKSYGDKPKREYHKKDEDGEKKPYAKKPYGDKKPYEKKEYGDRKPYAKREDGEKKPYVKKDYGDKKPYEKRDGEKPYVKKEYGDKKPYAKRDGEGKPYGERKAYGDRKPYAKREDGDKKPYAKKEYGDKKPYAKRDGDSKPYGDKKPYEKREGNKPYAKKEYGDKKPYAKRDGEGKSYGEKKAYGDRKPYAKRDSGDKPPRRKTDK